jgi:Zinc finger, ZZ type
MDAKQFQMCANCDGCQEKIFGVRYKCIECPDYDLCTDCEKRKFHPEHIILRLSRRCFDNWPTKNVFDLCLEDPDSTGECC